MPKKAKRPPRILAIDPGDTHSGWVLLEPAKSKVIRFGNHEPNEEVMEEVQAVHPKSTILVIELFRANGQPLYSQLIDTAFWAGRFAQEWPHHWETLLRPAVCYHLTGLRTGGDKRVRSALIERWGGGPTGAIGKKGSEGPLYGIAKDGWQALGCAVAYAEGLRNVQEAPVRPKDPDRKTAPMGKVQSSKVGMDAPGHPIRRMRRIRRTKSSD